MLVLAPSVLFACRATDGSSFAFQVNNRCSSCLNREPLREYKKKLKELLMYIRRFTPTHHGSFSCILLGTSAGIQYFIPIRYTQMGAVQIMKTTLRIRSNFVIDEILSLLSEDEDAANCLFIVLFLDTTLTMILILLTERIKKGINEKANKSI